MPSYTLACSSIVGHAANWSLVGPTPTATNDGDTSYLRNDGSSFTGGVTLHIPAVPLPSGYVGSLDVSAHAVARGETQPSTIELNIFDSASLQWYGTSGSVGTTYGTVDGYSQPINSPPNGSFFAQATAGTLTLGLLSTPLTAGDPAIATRVTYLAVTFSWGIVAPDVLPPLRQYPRDDFLGGAPRQGRKNGSTSIQSSARQGWKNTYR